MGNAVSELLAVMFKRYRVYCTKRLTERYKLILIMMFVLLRVMENLKMNIM